MWIPASVDEIEQAARTGQLEETPSFDAKRELPASPKKNVDVAVDVAAMTNDGGVLLYGVAEDDHERLTVTSPIEMVGAADRIGQIISTSIAEVPFVEVREYRCSDDPSRGYLAVIVPQSARAPHQVTVGGDLRFYGRGPKGNRRLTEGEIARLYERRQQWNVEREQLLADCIAHAPLEPAPDAGFVYAFARPVVPDQEMWDRAAAAAGGEQALQREALGAASSIRVNHTFDPSFASGGHYWERQGADAWRVSKWSERDYHDSSYREDPTTLAEAVVGIDGRGRMFCGRGTDVGRGEVRVIFEVAIAGTVAGLFAIVSTVYELAGYHGLVDVGVAVTNVRGAVSLRMEGAFGSKPYAAATYERHARFAAGELKDSEARTLDLLGRFFQTTSGLAEYNPFVDMR